MENMFCFNCSNVLGMGAISCHDKTLEIYVCDWCGGISKRCVRCGYRTYCGCTEENEKVETIIEKYQVATFSKDSTGKILLTYK